jgi:hypothetical protein
MAAASAGTHSLPAEFAVFPLEGALLLPHGRLPLNIFEPRYIAMIEDALAHGRVIGMVQPSPQAGGGPHGGPGLYSVGCLGRITSFSETDDGRFLITLSGLTRFTILEELPLTRGYRRVRADLAAFAGDLDLQGGGAGFDRHDLLESLKGYFTRRGFDANWDAIEQMEDEALVVTLAMVCPFEPAEKQALLEADTPADRAQTLLALLAIDAHSPDVGQRGDKRGDQHGRPRPS